MLHIVKYDTYFLCVAKGTCYILLKVLVMRCLQHLLQVAKGTGYMLLRSLLHVVKDLIYC